MRLDAKATSTAERVCRLPLGGDTTSCRVGSMLSALDASRIEFTFFREHDIVRRVGKSIDPADPTSRFLRSAHLCLCFLLELCSLFHSLPRFVFPNKGRNYSRAGRDTCHEAYLCYDDESEWPR
jgi:hypothetical protein